MPAATASISASIGTSSKANSGTNGNTRTGNIGDRRLWIHTVM